MDMKKRAASAINSIWPVMQKGKTETFVEINHLFSALVQSVLLYGAAVWAPNYEDIVEQTQLQFYKKFLGLERRTAGYLVRLETGRVASSRPVSTEG